MTNTPADSPATTTDHALSPRELMAGVRHELRTPINHIIGYSEMLQEEAEDEGAPQEFAADLQRVRSEGLQLLSLVNSFLDSAETLLDKGRIVRMRHELRTPLNSIIGYCEMLEEDSSEQGRGSFIPDLRRIGQAAKHMLAFVNEGLTAPVAEAGVEAPREPFSSEALRRTLARTVSPQGATAAVLEARPGRLLVVDDNETNRDMLSRGLERQGHTVTTAASGREALDLVAGAQFDLVLLDIMMPGLDGYHVLERLKSDPRSRDIPVIMLSSLDETDSVAMCIGLGAEDYLPKPFDSVLLRARIGASLERKHLRDQEVSHVQQIEDERARSDELLHVILPDEIVQELRETNEVKPRRYENVAVLFCDIVGFTPYCETHTPEEVVANLQGMVEAYEDIALRHGLQKIKTIGDAFMAAAGLLRKQDNPVLHCVKSGLEMVQSASTFPASWSVRVGIHAGPVMAGVLGHRQYLFDLWGDAVNTAARVESHGAVNAVNLSRSAWDDVASECAGQPLGMVEVKGKGELELFRVDRLRA